eukprot:6175090-Pleurochrysis_carterae.AAC.2
MTNGAHARAGSVTDSYCSASALYAFPADARVDALRSVLCWRSWSKLPSRQASVCIIFARVGSEVVQQPDRTQQAHASALANVSSPGIRVHGSTLRFLWEPRSLAIVRSMLEHEPHRACSKYVLTTKLSGLGQVLNVSKRHSECGGQH